MNQQKRSEVKMPDFGRPGGRPGGGGPMAQRMRAEKPKNAKKTLLRLLKYIGKSRMLVILLALIMVLVTVTELAGPALQGAAIDTISLGEDGFSVDFPSLSVYLGIMVVMFLCGSLLQLISARLAAKLTGYKIDIKAE